MGNQERANNIACIITRAYEPCSSFSTRYRHRRKRREKRQAKTAFKALLKFYQNFEKVDLQKNGALPAVIMRQFRHHILLIATVIPLAFNHPVDIKTHVEGKFSSNVGSIVQGGSEKPSTF